MGRMTGADNVAQLFPSAAPGILPEDVRIAEARQALARLVGARSDWTAFENFLHEACADSQMRRSARASTFAASLELAREGKIEMRQERAFAPIWLRPTGFDPGEERAA